jgi:hypothetical protein
MSSGGWRVDGETRHTHDPAAAAGQLTFVWDGSCRRWRAASAPISVSIVHLHHSGPAAAFDEIQPRRSHPVWSSNQCTGEWLLLFYLHRAQSLVLDRAILFCLAHPSRWQRTCGLNNLRRFSEEGTEQIGTCLMIMWFYFLNDMWNSTVSNQTEESSWSQSVSHAKEHTCSSSLSQSACGSQDSFLSSAFRNKRTVQIRFHSIPSTYAVQIKPTNHRAAALLVCRIRRQRSAARARASLASRRNVVLACVGG